MTITLLHISDLHFGTVIDAALQGVLQVLAHRDPDVVIVTGDVTQRGRASELRGFTDLLELLCRPRPGAPGIPRLVQVVPGNHDVDWWPPWRRIFAPLARFEAAVPADNRRAAVVVDDVVLLALGSVNPRRQVAGTLSPAALDDLRTIATGSPAAVRVAFTHHPLALDRPARRTHVVTNAAVAAASLAEAGIDVLLSGHLHLPFATTTATAFPTLSRAFVLAGAGTATSSRTRRDQPRALQLVTVASAHIDIERCEMAAGASSFDVVGHSHFARDPPDGSLSSGRVAGWRSVPGV